MATKKKSTGKTASKAAPKKAPAKKAALAKKKPATKRAPAKKPVAKKSPAKKVVAKKSPAKKPATKKQPVARTFPPAHHPWRSPSADDVADLLTSDDPIAGLADWLDALPAKPSLADVQAVLGCATLLLARLAHEDRGGERPKAVIDGMLVHWGALGAPSPHAEEFLRNALAAIGNDRARLARLAALVPAGSKAPELLFNLACANALAGDERGLLAALDRALAAGVAPAQVEREPDLAAWTARPAVRALLAKYGPPEIPVDASAIERLSARLRSAVRALVDLVQKHEEAPEIALGEPATIGQILDAERARGVSLPNDYRALLTVHDGGTVDDLELLGTQDLANESRLWQRGREFVQTSAEYGQAGIDACIPVANLGQPNNWLLWDPIGTVRGGEPGYVVVLTADELPVEDLAAALERHARIRKLVYAG
jgi:hypothetical protein